MKLRPRKTKKFIVKEQKTERGDTYWISQLSKSQIASFSEGSIDQKMKDHLDSCILLGKKIQGIDKALASCESDITGRVDNQERLRRNISTLKENADEAKFRQQYVLEMANDEVKLASLRQSKQQYEKDRAEAQKELDLLYNTPKMHHKISAPALNMAVAVAV